MDYFINDTEVKYYDDFESEGDFEVDPDYWNKVTTEAAEDFYEGL
jgi:hypothetical protein